MYGIRSRRYIYCLDTLMIVGNVNVLYVTKKIKIPNEMILLQQYILKKKTSFRIRCIYFGGNSIVIY